MTRLPILCPTPPMIMGAVPWHSPTSPHTKAVSFHALGKNARVDVVLLTATKVELDQVLRRLHLLPRQKTLLKVHASDETYDIGRYGVFPSSFCVA